MSQILLQIPEKMLKELEAVAPGSARMRSRFIQLAIQKALMELRDVDTREAYRATPQNAHDVHAAGEWDEWRPRLARKLPRRKSRKA